MKKNFVIGLLIAISILVGCTEADTVSDNLSKAADSFEVDRRIIFINGITDKYLLVIEGKCSLGNFDDDSQRSVTCKVGEDKYKKHYLGLSDNVTYLVEQLDTQDVDAFHHNVDAFHHRVIFRPEQVIPDIDIQTSNE